MTGDRRPVVRLDDMRAGCSWEFVGGRAAGRADRLDRVVGELRAAEDRVRHHGEWVVVTIAYEAAPAFDAAFRTAAAPPDGVPFVWWTSFGQRRPVPPVPAGAAGVLTSARRQGFWTPDGDRRRDFGDAVDVVRGRIQVGDAYQVNIADRYDGSYAGTALELYGRLLATQSCPYGAYIELEDRTIVSVSPELFFRWSGDTITCRPMKGTAPRSADATADQRAERELLASDKERAENVMIVDLLRNDLNRIARPGSVRVPHLFTVEGYETVWQLTSTVEADVPAGIDLVSVLAALFPCGSVTGAPKIAAMGIIDELEGGPRGVYCGAIGVLAPAGQGDRAVFSVPIRTAVVDPVRSTFEYGAGGGITWWSTRSAEDDEVSTKAAVLRNARADLCLLETMRLDERGVRNAGAHLDRLARSAAWLAVPFDRSLAERRLGELSSAVPQRLRLLVERSGAMTIERHPLDDVALPVLLAVDAAVTRADDPLCRHKTTWRRHYAEACARHPHAHDVVLVNEDGWAIEATTANLAYRLGDEWYTPPLRDGGLAGIGRMDALRRGQLAERSIRASDLPSCDEIALLNDLRGWRPARLE